MSCFCELRLRMMVQIPSDVAVDIKAYAFVGMYCAEVIIANFVIFPICTLTVFSDVLGCCGLVRSIGGRPYQVKKCERIQKRNETKQNEMKRNVNAKQEWPRSNEKICLLCFSVTIPLCFIIAACSAGACFFS